MTHPPDLREKARELRRTKGLTIDEIADRLAVGRTTVYSWVSDMPRPDRCLQRAGPPERIGSVAMKRKFKRLRDEAYELGAWEFHRLLREPNFRDYVCLYIAEGYKRCRNTVSIANSDLAVMRVGNQWIAPMTRNKVSYSIQYHADQDLKAICAFWGEGLNIDPGEIRLQRKSNSRGMKARTWRSKNGVLTIRVGDTMLRSRLQGWIDQLQKCWLDSPNGA